MSNFNSLFTQLTKISNEKTRSISAENFTGGKGQGGMAEEGTCQTQARELGKGWKVSPSLSLKAKTTTTLANINDSGVIKHIWMTCHYSKWRDIVLKIYWDNEKTPSVNVPIGDFFCNGWCVRTNVNSLAIAVNPAGGFNSYFEMPFKKNAYIEVVNNSSEDVAFFYQIDYVLKEVCQDAAYFHASWRRTDMLKENNPFVILDNVTGKGHYIGTYLAWQVNNNGWWGEGEVKFYIDGDKEYPTICGTGTEDYFGGAWNWEQPQGTYCTYSGLYTGMHQAIKPDGLYVANARFGMYRWHITDPIRFEKDLKVTIQDLGWRSEGRYFKQHSDIAATTYWYQTEPHTELYQPKNIDEYEVI